MNEENNNTKVLQGEYGFEDIDVPNEFKEYRITEWTSDHAHTSWWTYQQIMDEFGVNHNSSNPNEWHCMFHEVRIQSAKNVLTRQQIADKFRVKLEDLIILD